LSARRLRQKPTPRGVGLLLAALLGAGCGLPVEEGWHDAGSGEMSNENADPALVTASAWAFASDDDDPFAHHRAEDASCSAVGWGVEAGSLEVDTGACRYLVVEQPLLRGVAEGNPVEVTLWHQSLHADEDAVGHAALAVGGTLLWEREVNIPSPPGIYTDEVLAPRALAAGESVVFHLHNHGANTWNLASVALVDGPDHEED
jgi:hypothetical protein